MDQASFYFYNYRVTLTLRPHDSHKDTLKLPLQQKEVREHYWLSPQAGQGFCNPVSFAPHSTQYLFALLLSSMPTVLFSIDIVM
jgi:hypothetical protein